MISKEQQNLLNELQVPIKSFRIFALEELIKSASSAELIPELLRLKELETDRECLFMFDQAVIAIGNRLSGVSAVSAPLNNQYDFLRLWESSNEDKKFAILSDLPSRLPKDLRTLGPELLNNLNSPILIGKVIRVFCRSWPEDKLYLISNKLASESLTLKLAALRTLVHIKPEILINDLPVFLKSKDPQIKALAIRALSKIDKEEALKYLQALLLSSNSTERMAGIQNCLFLPFDMVKPALLKFFAAETNEELLKRAGWVIEMNPDVKIPFHLYEIAERSPAKKAQLVKKILNETVSLLNKSGILGENFSKYTSQLQSWVAKKNALRFVKQIAAYLNTDVVPEKIDSHIKANLNQDKVLEALQEAQSWPVSDKIKKNLQYYANYNKEIDKKIDSNAAIVKKEKDKSEKITLESYLSKSEQEKHSFIQNLNKINALASIRELSRIAISKDVAGECKSEIIDKLTEFKISGFEECAVKYITNHDIVVATAAVRYLGAVDPERVFPYLGKCLNVADINMKSAALGILKLYDFNQAISSLNAMLYSSDPKQQSMALKCLDQFDFDLIRDTLTEYLCKCTTEELAEEGLCHFAANPSADNVYSLYKIEQAHKGKIATQAKSLRESCPEPEDESLNAETNTETTSEQNNVVEENKTTENNNLQSKTNEIKKAKEAELKKKLEAEKEKKKSKKPAYAYDEIEAKRNSKDQIIAIYNFTKDWIAARNKWFLLIIVLLMAFIAWDFFIPKSKAGKRTASGALRAVKIVREGTVEKVNGTSIVFVTPQKEKFVLDPGKEGFPVPREDSLLRISLVPYRRYPDGSYIAKIRFIREIESYSKEFSGKAAK